MNTTPPKLLSPCTAMIALSPGVPMNSTANRSHSLFERARRRPILIPPIETDQATTASPRQIFHVFAALHVGVRDNSARYPSRLRASISQNNPRATRQADATACTGAPSCTAAAACRPRPRPPPRAPRGPFDIASCCARTTDHHYPQRSNPFSALLVVIDAKEHAPGPSRLRGARGPQLEK